MRVELNTNVVDSIVPDTYGSGFQYEIRSDCWEDFKQGMIDKAEEYLTKFLKKTDFKDVKLTMKNFYSPREYNFRTDDIGFELEFDDSLIDEMVEKAKADDKFIAFITKRYKSYDGFISFMPSTIDEFLKCASDRETNVIGHNKFASEIWKAIAAYLSYQISQNFDLDNEQREYIDDCWEYASQNGMNIDEEDEEEGIC